MTVWIWTAVFLAGVGFFSWQLWGRWRALALMRVGEGRNYSPSSWTSRLSQTLSYGFFQKKFFQGDQPAGVMHIVIFWGFLLLLFQVITMFVRGWAPEFSIPGFEGGTFAKVYALLKDFFQFGVIAAACIALYRWVVVKPTRLMGFLPAESRLRGQSHWEACLILVFIFSIMTSGFLYDAGRIVLYGHIAPLDSEKYWQPISLWFAGFLNMYTAGPVSEIAWWVHNGVILLFINLLPRSKHFHIITAIPNVFFGKVEPKGKLTKKNYEAENALFGTSQINHFTQKQVSDMYSCTECGRCSSVCPATASGKVLAPRQLLLNLRDAFYAGQTELLSGKKEFEPVVGEGRAVIDEVIWSCNACRACEEACPVNIEYIDKIVDIRQHLVQEAARFPQELNNAFKGMENQSNPWGISSSERTGWIEELKVPSLQDTPQPEYLYYVGCGSAFDAKNKNNTRSFIRILNQAQVSYAVLGNEELCNGETARRLGNEYLYQTMAQALVEKIQNHGIKKILVNCPHCFNTFKHEYPDFGAKWEIVRAADLVGRLVADGKVKMREEKWNKTVVYHDSCYYGRMNDVYEEPRTLVKGVPGVQLKEMVQSHSNAKCCGAGGGRMWLEEDKDKRVNIQRAEQALEQNPDVIATSCPFCKIMVGSAITEKGMDEKVKVMDVMEIVAGQMQV